MLFNRIKKLEQAAFVPTTAIASLTGAFGTTGNAIADVTGTFSQTILNNNFRALEDKVNAILVAMRTKLVIAT